MWDLSTQKDQTTTEPKHNFSVVVPPKVLLVTFINWLLAGRGIIMQVHLQGLFLDGQQSENKFVDFSVPP